MSSSCIVIINKRSIIMRKTWRPNVVRSSNVDVNAHCRTTRTVARAERVIERSLLNQDWKTIISNVFMCRNWKVLDAQNKQLSEEKIGTVWQFEQQLVFFEHLLQKVFTCWRTFLWYVKHQWKGGFLERTFIVSYSEHSAFGQGPVNPGSHPVRAG